MDRTSDDTIKDGRRLGGTQKVKKGYRDDVRQRPNEEPNGLVRRTGEDYVTEKGEV